MSEKRVKIRIRVDECPFCEEENEVTELGFDVCEHFVDFDFDNMEAIFENTLPKGDDCEETGPNLEEIRSREWFW